MNEQFSLTLTYTPILGQGDPPPSGGIPSGQPSAPSVAPTGAPTGPAGTQTSQPGQPGTTSPGVNPQAEDTGFFGGSGFFILLLGFIVIMYFFLLSNSRKEKRKRSEMLTQLKKGVKIETVGGVLGTIIEVRDQELIVKVDENNNTRLRFAKGAVKTVFEEESE